MTAKALLSLKEDYPKLFAYLLDLDERGCLVPINPKTRMPTIKWGGAEPLPRLPDHCVIYGVDTVRAGIAVLDLDRNHEDGGDGVASWEKFEEDNGLDLSGGLWVDTPSGGRHLWAMAPRGRAVISNSNVARDIGYPAIDLRGAGADGTSHGMGIGPGSQGYRKVNGVKTDELVIYRPTRDGIPGDDFPTLLLDRISEAKERELEARRLEVQDRLAVPGVPTGLTAYKRKIRDRIVADMARSGKGSIDTDLNNAHFQMGANGIRFEDYAAELSRAAVNAGATGGHELDKKWMKSWEKGFQHYDPTEDPDWEVNPHLKKSSRPILAELEPEERFSPRLITARIGQSTTLTKIKKTAQVFVANGIPEDLWRQELLDHSLGLKKREGYPEPRFTEPEVNSALDEAVHTAPPRPDRPAEFLSEKARTAIKHDNGFGEDLASEVYFDTKPMASRIVSQKGHLIRFDPKNSMWAVKDETRNVWVLGLPPTSLVASFTQAQYDLALATKDPAIIKAARPCLNAAFDGLVLKALSSMADIYRAFDHYNLSADFLNTPSGVIDLRTGRPDSSGQEHYFTQQTKVSVKKPTARGQRLWRAVLSAHPEERHEFIQLVEGNAISGHKDASHRILFNFGSGGNGKSLYDEVLASALGTFATSMNAEAILKPSSEFGLYPLFGVRRVSIHETTDETSLNTEQLKKIAGTEFIRAASKGKDSILFRNTCSCLFFSNHEPLVRATDRGTLRRLAYLAYDQEFQEDQDPELGEATKFDTEVLEAALWWAVQGAVKWYASGQAKVPLTPAIEADTMKWVSKGDRTAAFIMDHLVIDNPESLAAKGMKGHKIREDDLKDAYRLFARQNHFAQKSFDQFLAGLLSHRDLASAVKDGLVFRTNGRTTQWQHSTWTDPDKAQEASHNPNRPYAPRPAKDRGTRYVVGLRWRVFEDLTSDEESEASSTEIPDSPAGLAQASPDADVLDLSTGEEDLEDFDLFTDEEVY